MIRVSLNKNVDSYPIERIHPRYLKTDDATLQRATSNLYARPAPVPGFERIRRVSYAVARSARY
jgi:hypothetical protein